MGHRTHGPFFLRPKNNLMINKKFLIELEALN